MDNPGGDQGCASPVRPLSRTAITHRAAIALLALIATLLAVAAPADAERRIALVVTNQAYTQAGAALTNTHRDGDLVRAALERVGFKVTVVRDTPNEAALLSAFGDHVQRLAEAGPEAIGFVYYSGHGAADRPDGANYLIPTGAPITHVAQLPLMAVRLDKITETLARVGRINFVVFDACRNVPLQRAEKDLSFKGWAPVKEQSGLLVAYATEPGNVAVDQSIYARALADEIVQPGREASSAFRAVARRVLHETGNKQAPQYLDRRLHDFEFVALARPPEIGNAAIVPPTARPRPSLPPPRYPGWTETHTVKKGDTLSAIAKKFNVSEAELLRANDLGNVAQIRVGLELRVPPELIAPVRPTRILSTPPGRPAVHASPTTPQSLGCDGIHVALASGASQCIKPGSGQSFRDCPDCPEMVVMPAGSFMMGQIGPESNDARPGHDVPRPAHDVTLSRPYAIGKLEVTFEQWDACAAQAACRASPSDNGWGRGNRPVINVSWDDADRFVRWLAAKTGKRYRLPTEAEWEFAARFATDGTTGRYTWGDGIFGGRANCRGCLGSLSDKTAPVGSYPPSSGGPHDLHGNVAEWVSDRFASYSPEAVADPKGPEAGGYRVYRGGSWRDGPTDVRSFSRQYGPPEYRYSDLGFRVARTIDPE